MSKILIIDDERAIRRALREILEFEDFEVEEAENGKEGFDKASTGAYDIIFCDIKMPVMDGMEVLEELVKAKIESPIIMISGHGNIDTAVQAIKKGAFDFIVDKAVEYNLGARGLRSICEAIVTDAMYDIPSDSSITDLNIDEAYARSKFDTSKFKQLQVA